MALLGKYKMLISAAKALITDNLQVLEDHGVLIIQGTASNAEAKNKLWDIYSQIDPNFISKDVSLDVRVSPNVKGCEAILSMDGAILAVHKGPGVELPTLGNVQKDEIVQIISRANMYWWLIRIADMEGYCYAEHMELAAGE